MAALTASMLLPSKLKSSNFDEKSCLFSSRCSRSLSKRTHSSSSPVMRLFGPAIFEASKLKVLILGVDEEKHPPKLPRTYTLTHSDITSKLTLAISQTINKSQLQGWYNKLYRDEVVAEWKKVKGKMSLHVHCHISGGHFLLDLIAPLRYYIFCNELPVVLNAFVHGDEDLFNKCPELQEAMVWVYFHSSIPEYNNVECWGPLMDALQPTSADYKNSMMLMMINQEKLKQQEQEQQEEDDNEASEEETTTTSVKSDSKWKVLETCTKPCECCYPPTSLIPWTPSSSSSQTEQQQQQQRLPGDVSTGAR